MKIRFSFLAIYLIFASFVTNENSVHANTFEETSSAPVTTEIVGETASVDVVENYNTTSESYQKIERLFLEYRSLDSMVVDNGILAFRKLFSSYIERKDEKVIYQNYDLIVTSINEEFATNKKNLNANLAKEWKYYKQSKGKLNRLQKELIVHHVKDLNKRQQLHEDEQNDSLKQALEDIVSGKKQESTQPDY